MEKHKIETKAQILFDTANDLRLLDDSDLSELEKYHFKTAIKEIYSAEKRLQDIIKILDKENGK